MRGFCESRSLLEGCTSLTLRLAAAGRVLCKIGAHIKALGVLHVYNSTGYRTGEIVRGVLRVRCLVCFTLPAREVGCAKPGEPDCLTVVISLRLQWPVPT